MKLLIIYLAVVNIAAFMLMGIDKRRAKRGAWRIPERTLFLPAILGGSLGAILGMQVFRHKTRHRQFTVGMPLILLVQLAVVGVLFFLYRAR
ncbi:MAG: DUF1294 domain-containing protein [Oscillospiraceae bacterium]|nr:DUF1294 domain-containing protein [Oscillospiraceae bacterium]